MKNFTYQNPTKLVFGKGQISKLAELIPAGKKIMVTFGGGSVKNNGVYDQVTTALHGFDVTEFWGIEPNPKVETLSKAIELGKQKDIDFLLAVGGGSVLDGTKLISAALAMPEKEAWDIVLEGQSQKNIPYASVMTLPATGSEMNRGSVISRLETKDKRAFYAVDYPQFSILDPQVTYTLPKNQLANGLSDTYVHVMEQYMTTTGQSRVMDRWAEGILQTIVDIAPKVLSGANDYDTMADFMLSATLALNDMIRMGVTEDWATHMIGHELTALYGISHGASLAIVYPGTMSVMREQKRAKLLQYAGRVFGITEGGEDERINLAIAKTVDFFSSLGLATRLSDAGIPDEAIAEVGSRFDKYGVCYGEAGNITGDTVRKILEARK